MIWLNKFSYFLSEKATVIGMDNLKMIEYFFYLFDFLCDIFLFFRSRMYLLFIFEVLNLCDVYFSLSLLY